MSFPSHAFSPFLNPVDESDVFFDIWRNTGLKGQAYFAARNDAVPLIIAAQSNNLEMVQTLISRGVAIDEKGLEGETALHMGSALGYVNMVRAFIDAGASPDAKDEEGSTPLIHCARFCPPGSAIEIASILLDAGANPAHMVTVDLFRCSPLWFSICAHNQSFVQLLEPLTPCDVDVYPPETGRNRILEAAIEDADRHIDTSILEFLIQHRQLRLRPLDLAKAAEYQTFSVLVQQLSLPTEDVAKMGADILLGVWATDRRRIVDCLRRLVKQYHLDVNGREVQEFVLTSRSTELVNAAVGMGLDVATCTRS